MSPFDKITSGPDRGKYRSPSGRVFSPKQVRLYYASDGFDTRKMKEMRQTRERAVKMLSRGVR